MEFSKCFEILQQRSGCASGHENCLAIDQHTLITDLTATLESPPQPLQCFSNLDLINLFMKMQEERVSVFTK
jgi:hypothetical protein